MLKILLIIAFLVQSSFLTFALNDLTSKKSNQTDSIKTKPQRYNYLSIRYTPGYVLPTNDFVKGVNEAGDPINFYQSLDISYGVQTDGSKDWHHIFNFPYYGVSFYNANFFDRDELGMPTALFGFMGLPLERKENSLFGYELGFGLTYNWNAYDPIDNPFNIAIGSYRTVYINANLFYEYYINKRWSAKGGLGFTHFSNGGTKKPNSGLNLASPFIKLTYSLKDRPELERLPQADYDQHYEVAIQYGIGAKNKIYTNPNNEELYNDAMFSFSNFSAAFLKQTTWKNKFGAGFDLTYDEMAGATVTFPENDIPQVDQADHFGDKLMLGLFGTYEFTVNRLSVASYFGAYAFRKTYDGMPPLLYQKFGLKYHFKRDIYIGLLVRAHNFSVADVIEWNLGYRIKWN